MSRSDARAALSACSLTSSDTSDVSPVRPLPFTARPPRAMATSAAIAWWMLLAGDATAGAWPPPLLMAEPVPSSSSTADDSHVVVADGSTSSTAENPRPPSEASVAIDTQWTALLDKLATRVVNGSLVAVQHQQFLGIWYEAIRRAPRLRRPAVGLSGDGHLQASWSFTDVPGRAFTIEIDREGSVDWFFRDAEAGLLEGADDELPSHLPAQAFDLLVQAFQAR